MFYFPECSAPNSSQRSPFPIPRYSSHMLSDRSLPVPGVVSKPGSDLPALGGCPLLYCSQHSNFLKHSFLSYRNMTLHEKQSGHSPLMSDGFLHSRFQASQDYTVRPCLKKFCFSKKQQNSGFFRRVFTAFSVLSPSYPFPTPSSLETSAWKVPEHCAFLSVLCLTSRSLVCSE